MNFYKNKVKENELHWQELLKENGDLKARLEGIIKELETKQTSQTSSEFAKFEARIQELENELSKEKAEKELYKEKFDKVQRQNSEQKTTNNDIDESKIEKFTKNLQAKFENMIAGFQKQMQQFITEATNELLELKSSTKTSIPSTMTPTKAKSFEISSNKSSPTAHIITFDAKEPVDSPKNKIPNDKTEPTPKPINNKSTYTRKIEVDTSVKPIETKNSRPQTATHIKLGADSPLTSNKPEKIEVFKNISKTPVYSHKPILSFNDKSRTDMNRSVSPKPTLGLESDNLRKSFVFEKVNESISGKSESRMNDSTTANTKDELQLSASTPVSQKPKKKGSTSITSFHQTKDKGRLKSDALLMQFRKK